MTELEIAVVTIEPVVVAKISAPSLIVSSVVFAEGAVTFADVSERCLAESWIGWKLRLWRMGRFQ